MSRPVRPKPSRPCPICGKVADRAYDPFCSRRCKEVDLGNWLGGRYAIPTAESPTGEETAPSAAGDDTRGGEGGAE